MSALGATLSTLGGLVLIGLAGRDVFHALFHPEGRSAFVRLIGRGLWRLFRSSGRERLLPLAGPSALVAVIAVWAGLLIAGWALVYWPHVPDGFRFDAGMERGGALLNAMNLSLVTLTTLGFGDVTPEAAALRLILPVEALVGFGLLSASISWLLLIYPVLARRRSLAYEISLLRQAESDTELSLDRLEPEAIERIYAEFTSRLIAVERDFVHFPISYYFTESDRRFSLPAAAPYLLELGERGARPERPDRVRLRAVLLLEAVGDLASTAANFHGGRADTADAVLRAYARDHLVGEATGISRSR